MATRDFLLPLVSYPKPPTKAAIESVFRLSESLLAPDHPNGNRSTITQRVSAVVYEIEIETGLYFEGAHIGEFLEREAGKSAANAQQLVRNFEEVAANHNVMHRCHVERRTPYDMTRNLIEAARRHHGIAISSSCNLFVTTGRQILGLRHCFDFGHYRTGSPDQLHEANMNFLSMWFTTGRDYGLHDGEWQMVGGEEEPRAVIVASEPLSSNSATWMPVPEYAMIHAEMDGNRPAFRVVPLAR